MPASPFESSPTEILLDGQPIHPPPGRASLAAVGAYLETLALGQQRILCSLMVDGEPMSLHASTSFGKRPFTRIEAWTINLEQLPLQLLATAIEQSIQARAQVEQTILLVLINDSRVAQEVWWNLARTLKQPLLTISLVPATTCSPKGGGASPLQLRKWQLEQLGNILQTVDEACHTGNPERLSTALEHRVLPWLQDLHQLLLLWRETVQAGMGAPRNIV